MINTLVVTIAMESMVVIAYSNWHKKAILPILIATIAANIITQAFLWLVLNVFFHQYLSALLVSEVVIWLVESFLLYYVCNNWLQLRQAIFLSLGMNLASFVVGWFLPI